MSDAVIKTVGLTRYFGGKCAVDWMRVRDLESFQKNFYPQWDGRAGKLSRGQRAGLSLALTLATWPELLVMDDPAIGLDPVARRTLLEAMILVTPLALGR